MTGGKLKLAKWFLKVAKLELKVEKLLTQD